MRRRVGIVPILAAVIVLLSPAVGNAGGARTYTYLARADSAYIVGVSQILTQPHGDVVLGGFFIEARSTVVRIKIDDHAVPTGKTIPLLVQRQSGSYFSGCVKDGSRKSVWGLKRGQRVYVAIGNAVPTVPGGCDSGATVGHVTISF